MHLESIQKGIDENRPHNEIIRKVYLTYPTMALIGDEERQFKILNEISEYFNIPINNIQVAGSAKTGMSFHKNKAFTPTISDLDIAIINTDLFRFYTEYIFKMTNGYNDRTAFPFRNGRSTFTEYTTYLSKGIFRPDLMPSCIKRANWFEFFGRLSTEHKDLFKNINAGIYISQIFFEHKQCSIINDYISNNAV